MSRISEVCLSRYWIIDWFFTFRWTKIDGNISLRIILSLIMEWLTPLQTRTEIALGAKVHNHLSALFVEKNVTTHLYCEQIITFLSKQLSLVNNLLSNIKPLVELQKRSPFPMGSCCSRRTPLKVNKVRKEKNYQKEGQKNEKFLASGTQADAEQLNECGTDWRKPKLNTLTGCTRNSGWQKRNYFLLVS